MIDENKDNIQKLFDKIFNISVKENNNQLNIYINEETSNNKILNIENKIYLGDIISNCIGPSFLFKNKSHNEIVIYIFENNRRSYFITMSSTKPNIVYRLYTIEEFKYKYNNIQKYNINISRYNKDNINYNNFINNILFISYIILKYYEDINNKIIKFSIIISTAKIIYYNCFKDTNFDISIQEAKKLGNIIYNINNNNNNNNLNKKINVVCSTFIAQIINLALYLSYNKNKYKNNNLYFNPYGCAPYNLVSKENKYFNVSKLDVYLICELDINKINNILKNDNILKISIE